MQNQHVPFGIYEKYVKRPLECLLALCVLVPLSPVFGIVALLVRVKLGSPVLFTQERPGKNEKIFKLCKFRSMSDARDENGELLPDDQRLTRFGRLLRSTSLDELPELLNIIRGDMSLIGPRPLLAAYIPYYTEREHHRHDVRPGLSGLAQVHGRNATTWAEMFAWDLKYVERITFWGDVKILFLTVYKVVKRADILVGSQHVEGRLDVERSKAADMENLH